MVRGFLPNFDVDLEDEVLLEKAKTASNGEKFERLWTGNILAYDSQSEADMALCCLLAFWTGGDPTRMDRLFRQSALLREKWDEVHYADGSTYGEKTIERAIATTSEYYDPGTSAQSSEFAGTADETRSTAGRDTTQSEVYLTEKNRLLAQRVAELEATLEEKTARITTLETDLRKLEETLSKRNDQIVDLQARRETDDGDPTTQGILSRLLTRALQ